MGDALRSLMILRGLTGNLDVPGGHVLSREWMPCSRGSPIRSKPALVMGTNPALTYPNTTRVRQALEQLDLLVVLVVMDMFKTSTAAMADIVLPAASPYERTQLITSAAPFGPDQPQWWIALRQGVVDPGDRRSDWWLLRSLAHRLGYAAFYPWESEEEAIDTVLRPLGITVAELKARPDGIFYGDPPVYRSYEQRVPNAHGQGRVLLSRAGQLRL